MNILITGGSGFIGQNLVQFIESNYKAVRIINIDIRPPKVADQRKYWVALDIMDAIKLKNFVRMSGFDFVIHLAARTDLSGLSDSDYLVNTEGTQNLINALSGSLTLKRVIFTSSMLVCGPGYHPNRDDDYSPTTAYGRSKALMEDIIRGSGLRECWLIVRPTSIWGPWFDAPYRDFFEIVRRGLFFHPGDMACTKTYGYVGNLVHHVGGLLTAPFESVNGKVFYLGDDPAINISLWADEIRRIYANKNNRKLPYLFFIVLGLIGDILLRLNIRFPMTSFRLRNMTTNNIIDLKHLYDVVGRGPYDRYDGTRLTIEWILNDKSRPVESNSYNPELR